MHQYKLDKTKSFEWNWKQFKNNFDEWFETNDALRDNCDWIFVEEAIDGFIYDYMNEIGFTKPLEFMNSLKDAGSYKGIKWW